MKKTTTAIRGGCMLLFFLLSQAFFTKVSAQTSCKAGFSYLKQGSTVYFTDTSKIIRKDTIISTQYIWTFGDGTGNIGRGLPHDYKKPGTYSVCLKIVDTKNNCSDSICKSITITGCEAAFGYVIYDNMVEFNNFSIYKSADFHWDFGDGATSKELKTSHLYSDLGTYNVTLKLYDSINNCRDSVTKSVIISSLPRISGMIQTYNYNGDHGKVYLIRFNTKDSTLSAIDSSNFMINDSFKAIFIFANVKPGRYLVKAALDKGSPNYSDFFPTYCSYKLKWSEAQEITTDYNSGGGSISMQKGNNPGGKGFISGKISQGANKAAGDPLENIQVMLFDENLNPITYTYTDASGSFSFANIPLGKFQVYTEVVGLKTMAIWVTLTAANPKEDGIDVKIGKKSIITSIRKNNFYDADNNNISIYPNPVKDQLNVSIEKSITKGAKLIIYDNTGRQLLTETIAPSGNNAQTININTTQLPAGVYLMQLQLNNELIRQFKFVK